MTKELATELEPEVPAEEIQAEEAKEASADPPKETKAEPEKEKTVPHQALHEERERRKQAQREFEQYKRDNESKMAVLNDRLQQIYSAQKPQQQGYIDPRQAGEHVVDALAHNQQLTAQQLATMQAVMANEAASRQQAYQQSQLVGWARQQATEYQSEAPDFADAYNHMLKIRTSELQAMGLPAHEIEQRVAQDELWVYQQARQQGKNPAEIIYQMAKGAGYQKKASAEEKVAQLNKGQNAAKGLGNGGSDPNHPTPEQIAAMSEDEFAEFKKKIGGKDISQVL